MKDFDIGDIKIEIPAIAQGKKIPYSMQLPYEESAAGRQEAALKSISENTKNLEELKRIADAAEERARIAEIEAAEAQKTALVANIGSIFAIAVAILSWLVPRETVVLFFRSLFGI